MKTPNCGDSTCKRGGGTHGRRRVAAVCWLLATLSTPLMAADYPMEIIDLRYRLPEDLVPILQPLAGPDGSVVGANNTLFVRAAPARLADIHRALNTLDRPARNLLIQVRQRGNAASSGAGGGVQVDEWVGNNTHLQVGRTGPGGSQVELGAASRTQRRDLTQEVRTLDGRPAFIAVGQDQPMAYRELTVGPGGTRVMREGSSYRRNESGFYVVPRVQGDRVTLEINTRADAAGPHGTRDTSQVEAQVQGRLGDWLPVALSNDAESVRGSGTLYYGQGQRSNEGRVELRVVPLD